MEPPPARLLPSEVPAPDAMATEATELLRLLSQPIRRRICLMLIEEGELGPESFRDRLALTQSSLTRHLSALKASGIVERRRDRNRACYTLRGGPRGRLAASLHALARIA